MQREKEAMGIGIGIGIGTGTGAALPFGEASPWSSARRRGGRAVAGLGRADAGVGLAGPLRRMERALRAQGLRGTQYRFLHGDLTEDLRLVTAARSKPVPMDRPHDFIPRVAPLLHRALEEHGTVLALLLQYLFSFVLFFGEHIQDLIVVMQL